MTAAIEFTDEIAVELCARVCEGEPLTTIAKSDGMPSLRTLFRWLKDREEFRELYNEARVNAAHTLFSQALEIADEGPTIVEREGEKVTVRYDSAAVADKRERIRARQFAAERLLPRVYGPKQEVAIGGAPDLPPVQMDIVDTARRMAFIFAGAEHELAKRPAPPLLIEAPRPEAPAAPAAEPAARFASPFYPSARPSDDDPPYPCHLSTPDDEDGALFSTSKELPLHR